MNIINAHFATPPQYIGAVVYFMTNMTKYGNAQNAERYLKIYIGLNTTAEK